MPKSPGSPQLLSLALMGAVALAWTATAFRAWPLWDDGWLALAADQVGAGGVEHALADRPAVGAIYACALRADALLRVSAAAHALAWFGVGVVAMQLFRRVYPEWGALGVVAGLVAESPIFATTQPVLINPVFSGLLPALMVWVPLVWLWPDRARGNGRRGWLRIPAVVLGAAVGILGCLSSEYGVAAGLAGGAVMLAASMRRGASGERGSVVPGAIVLGLSLGSFVMFRALVDPTVRAGVGPGALASHGAARAVSFPFFMASSLFQAELGAVLARIGDIRIEQGGMERSSVLALAVGLVAAGLATWWCRDIARAGEPGAPSLDEDAPLRGLLKRSFSHVTVLLGIAAGLAPFCVMARVPAEGAASRFWLPVLPLVAAQSLSVAVSAGRSALSRRLLVAVLVGTAAFSSVVHASRAVQDRARVRRLSVELAPHLARGPTLVVLADSDPWPAYTRDYELTERLRTDMPAGTSRRFWVTRELPEPSTGLSLAPGPEDGSRPPTLRIDWLRAERPEQVSLERIVWASVGADGHLRALDEDHPAAGPP